MQIVKISDIMGKRYNANLLTRFLLNSLLLLFINLKVELLTQSPVFNNIFIYLFMNLSS